MWPRKLYCTNLSRNDHCGWRRHRSRPQRKVVQTSHVRNFRFADQIKATTHDEFNFEHELEQEDYFTAYQFIQCATVYTEDMSGNRRYCLNMKRMPLWGRSEMQR